MNIEEKIRILLNKTIDYDSRILKPNFVSELTSLIQQEREKAVREFVEYTKGNVLTVRLTANELHLIYKDYRDFAEQFLKESEGK